MWGIIVLIITLAANWKIFQKMGHEGWEGIVPFYNTYVLFKELYGNGWKMLLLLIPLYNIYVSIKLYIDLAKAFNKGTGFGIGLFFLNTIFMCILAFGSATYGDGTAAVESSDVISTTLDKVAAAATGTSAAVKKDPNALNKIKELNELRENGVISEEEFQQKKSELLDRI